MKTGARLLPMPSATSSSDRSRTRKRPSLATPLPAAAAVSPTPTIKSPKWVRSGEYRKRLAKIWKLMMETTVMTKLQVMAGSEDEIEVTNRFSIVENPLE